MAIKKKYFFASKLFLSRCPRYSNQTILKHISRKLKKDCNGHDILLILYLQIFNQKNNTQAKILLGHKIKMQTVETRYFLFSHSTSDQILYVHITGRQPPIHFRTGASRELLHQFCSEQTPQNGVHL